MVPDRTDKIENSSAQTTPSATSTMTSPLHADDNSSPSMSMQSPSPSKKRPRRGVNGSRYSKRRRLSQCSLSPDVVGTRTRSKDSIPTKLDDMESWCTLLSYIDDFVSRKFITEQQGRELRKLVRYKDKELKNLYNSVDKAKNEKDLLSLFKLAHERCPKLSSPFVPTTPNSLSSDQAGFSSPPTMYQATPPLSCDPSAPLSSMDQNVAATNHDENNHNKNTNKNENNTPYDENTDKNNRNNDNYTQVPSMQDILQQLSHLDTGFAETPIQDTSSFLEKNQFHENSPNSKTIQQHLQAQRPQKRNQQDATVTERSSAYNELSESELYYLLMSELHKTPPNQYTSEELSPSPVPHANSITIESNYNDTTQQNFDPTTTSPAASYQDFCNLFGFQSTSSSAPTPFQTPTSSSQAGHSSHEEELHYITNSLLNVDFESPCSYMDINAGCVDNAAMQVASPSETQSSNGNEDPPLSLLLPIDDNNNDNNSNNNNSYNEQTDFPLPDAPRFEDYCDYYESSNHY